MNRRFVHISVLLLILASCGPSAEPGADFSQPRIVSLSVEAGVDRADFSASLAAPTLATGYAFAVEGIGEYPAVLDGTSFRASADGLEPERAYSVVALVKNGDRSVRSDLQSFTTQPVPLPVLGVPEVVPNHFSAKLRLAFTSAYPDYFEFGFGVAGEEGEWTKYPVEAENGTIGYTWRGLKADTPYRCYGFARLGERSVQTEPVSFRTLESPYDPVFWSYILQAYDINNDGEIGDDEAARVHRLDLGLRNLPSLAGVERFTELGELYASINDIHSVDLSANLRLICLELNENPLIGLDISANTDLLELSVQGSGLKELDLSHNINLRVVHIGDNQLTSIDVTMLHDLSSLYVSTNQLTELDLSGCPLLTEVLCDSNPGLTTVWLKKEQLETLQIIQKDPFTEIKFK